jgi:peroxiredoxin
MTNRIRLAALLVLAQGLIFLSVPALAVDPGKPAPPFELFSLMNNGSIRSDELFSEHDYTFLVFWRSSCPHCIEALLGCERFYRVYGGENIAVIGINADEADLFETKGIIESNGITFPQARDVGGTVAETYHVPYATFTLYVVGSGARVIDARFDPQGDVGTVMEQMLATLPSASAASEPADAGSGISYQGLQRMRFLSIDSRGSSAVGLYGEPVSPGNSLIYRLQVEVSKRLMKHLRAGGLLRISNEGKRVLDSGPQYLGAEWGSAFAEIEARRLRVRLGYYEIFMTPLTLMRWDWDDNPRVGGDAGCGCGATAGAVLVESLEELGPTFTFEGAVASYYVSDFEARLFYAIPRRARETKYSTYASGAGERARYSLELYGFEGKWQRFDARTGSFWKAGVHALGSFEDNRSVDFAALRYLAADPWTSTRIVSVSSEAPLVRYARLRGELVLWNSADEEGIVTTAGTEAVSHEGGGGIGGIVIEKSKRLGIALDYLRLDPDFFTPFAALSYEPNTEGPRVSGRVPLLGDLANLSVFYKKLREADSVVPGMERKQVSLAGASLDLNVPSGWGAGIGWLEKKSWRHGELSPFDAYRRAIVASLQYRFEKVGVLQFQYQKIKSIDLDPDRRADSTANLYSLYSSIYF